MAAPIRIVGVSGSTSPASRTTELVGALVAAAAARTAAAVHLVTLAELAPSIGRTVHRGEAPAPLVEALAAIESADLLVVGTPVYRGSYAGLFKHLFDLVDQHALEDVPVLLAATGGSQRHALIVDHHLRPLFAFFRAITLPVGVYAAAEDFVGGRIIAPDLQTRIERAVDTGLPFVVAQRSSVVQPA